MSLNSIITVTILLFIPNTGEAYIDPGTGFVVATGIGWIIAMVAGLFGGLGMFFKRFLFKTIRHILVTICCFLASVGAVLYFFVL